MIVKTSKSGGRFNDITTPLFPSYLFIGSLLKKVPWRSINATRGVKKIVTLDGKYRAVNAQIIQGLKQRCDETGLFHKMEDILSGDQVRIERGPFSEFICRVEQVAEDQRVWLLIDILQQQIRTKIPLSDLSRLT